MSAFWRNAAVDGPEGSSERGFFSLRYSPVSSGLPDLSAIAFSVAGDLPAD